MMNRGRRRLRYSASSSSALHGSCIFWPSAVGVSLTSLMRPGVRRWYESVSDNDCRHASSAPTPSEYPSRGLENWLLGTRRTRRMSSWSPIAYVSYPPNTRTPTTVCASAGPAITSAAAASATAAVLAIRIGVALLRGSVDSIRSREDSKNVAQRQATRTLQSSGSAARFRLGSTGDGLRERRASPMSRASRLAGAPLAALAALSLVSLETEIALAARGQATSLVVYALHGYVCAALH